MIDLQRISRRFGDHVVLDQVSVRIAERERVGIIGDNGAGKTTLVKILAGVEEPDSGERQVQRGVRIGYGAQIPDIAAGTSVFDYVLTGSGEFDALAAAMQELAERLERLPDDQAALAEYGHLQAAFEAGGGYSRRSLCERVLSGLGFAEAEWGKDCAVLSGGERSRAALAALMTAPADLLILDEPTNHLDIEGITFLEDFVSRYPGAVAVVSHDRDFLDATCTRVLEVALAGVTSYPGGYRAYVQQRDQALLTQVRAYKNQQDFIAKETDYIRRNLAGQNSAQAKGRLKRLQRLEQIARPRKPPRRMRLQLGGGRGLAGQTVVGMEDLHADLPDGRRLFAGLDARLLHGEVLAILGPNGVGKSTLLRAIAGQPSFVAGHIEIAPGMRAGYFSQEMQELPQHGSVLDALRVLDAAVPEKELRDHLALFLFTEDDVERPVVGLSGGEKRRLCLARLTRTTFDYLCLDEPTNHLDIATRERLEEALADYQGAVAMISHDRAFVRALADRVLWLDKDGGKVFDGGLDQCLERRAEARRAARDAEARSRERDKSRAPAVPPPPAAPGRIRNPQLFARLEEEIFAMEDELGRARTAMAEPDAYLDPAKMKQLQVQEAALQERLAAAYERWESW